jgi:hypothetical protein
MAELPAKADIGRRASSVTEHPNFHHRCNIGGVSSAVDLLFYWATVPVSKIQGS